MLLRLHTRYIASSTQVAEENDLRDAKIVRLDKANQPGEAMLQPELEAKQNGNQVPSYIMY